MRDVCDGRRYVNRELACAPGNPYHFPENSNQPISFEAEDTARTPLLPPREEREIEMEKRKISIERC